MNEKKRDKQWPDGFLKLVATVFMCVSKFCANRTKIKDLCKEPTHKEQIIYRQITNFSKTNLYNSLSLKNASFDDDCIFS